MKAFAGKANIEERFLSNLDLHFENIYLTADEKNQLKIKIDHLLEKAPLNSIVKLVLSHKSNSIQVDLTLSHDSIFFTANSNESNWSTALMSAIKKIESQLVSWKKNRDLSFITVGRNSVLES